MEFDVQRAAVLAGTGSSGVGSSGDGIVARFAGIVCVARCPEPDLLRQLLNLCADASGPDPGRALGRSLARWLASADDLPDRVVFGTVSAAGAQLAVFLSGAVGVEVGELSLSGTEAAAWTDRLLPIPDAPVLLSLHGIRSRQVDTEMLDLRAGVVPGAGVVLHAGARGDSFPPPPRAAERPVVVTPPPVLGPERLPTPLPAPQPVMDRSPLAPDVPSVVDRHEPDARPRIDEREPAPEPVRETRSDEPGVDEEFTAGEWFGPTASVNGGPGDGAGDGAAAPVWVEPVLERPAQDRPEPERSAGGADPLQVSGRHAVLEPLLGLDSAVAGSALPTPRPTNGSAAAVDHAVEVDPPTPSNGQLVAAAAMPAVEEDESKDEPGAEDGDVEVDPDPPTTATPQTVPAPRAAPRAPRRAEAIMGVAPAGASRMPLDEGNTVGIPTARPAPSATNGSSAASLADGEQAQGQQCARGHLNDPRSQFCVLCGVRMNERESALVVGMRPPLGLLVFDDGATYTVDAEYLVGRMPESDARVISGGLRSIVVEDRSGAVSRVHAEIRLDGWDVLLSDSGSRNGTFVAGPSQQGWTPLPPGRSRRLVPGTRVRMGGRTFIFESPAGVR